MAEGPRVPAPCPQAVGAPGVWDGLKDLVYKVAETLPWAEHSGSWRHEGNTACAGLAGDRRAGHPDG